MTENYHSIEIVPERALSDSDRREYLEWAGQKWCHDSSAVRYSCPDSDVWFEKEVELSRAVNEIVTHGSGTITGLRSDSVPFTISIGMSSLTEKDAVTISTGESTFKSSSTSGNSDRRVDEWVALAREFYSHLDAVLVFATNETLDEAETGELEFRLSIDDVHKRRLSDVFWLMIMEPEFVTPSQMKKIEDDREAELEVLPDESLLVRFTANPLDFGPERKRYLRETLITSL